MFILETNDVVTVMFVKGQKVESDIDLWHKQFGHVNFLWLRERFRVAEIQWPKGPNMRSLPIKKTSMNSISQ